MATGAADAGATTLQQRREAVVREHMESENVHDFDTTIGTFDHPRYEIIPTGEIHDGEEAVRQYFHDTRTAFPSGTADTTSPWSSYNGETSRYEYSDAGTPDRRPSSAISKAWSGPCTSSPG